MLIIKTNIEPMIYAAVIVKNIFKHSDKNIVINFAESILKISNNDNEIVGTVIGIYKDIIALEENSLKASELRERMIQLMLILLEKKND